MMPMDSASSPKTLSVTMRRVTLDELCSVKNWSARRSQPPTRRNPRQRTRGSASPWPSASIGASASAGAWASSAPAVFASRSSTWSAGVSISPHPTRLREKVRRGWTPLLPHVSRPVRGHDSPVQGPAVHGRLRKTRALFLETITYAVQRLDHIEIVVAGLELLAQPLDVAVDGAVVDIDLVGVRRRH